MLISVRLVGWLLQVAGLAALALAILMWDAKSHVLYGWNSVHVGYSILAILAVIGAGVAREPLVHRLLGFRVVLANGTRPTFFHKASRALLFWLLLTSPGVFRIDAIFGQLPLSTRESLIASAGAAFALMLLPALTALSTRGTSSIHDLLVGTRIVRASPWASGTEGKPVRSALTLRGALICYSWSLAVLLLVGMLLDWRYRISDTYSAYFRARTRHTSADRSG